MNCKECEHFIKQIKALQKGANKRRIRHMKYKELVRNWKCEYEAKSEKLLSEIQKLQKRIYEIRKGIKA